MQVALDDQVGDLCRRFDPLFPVHVCQQVEGPHQEMAAAASRVEQRDIAQAARFAHLARLALRRSHVIGPVCGQPALRVQFQPERAERVLEQVVHHVALGVEAGRGGNLLRSLQLLAFAQPGVDCVLLGAVVVLVDPAQELVGGIGFRRHLRRVERRDDAQHGCRPGEERRVLGVGIKQHAYLLGDRQAGSPDGCPPEVTHARAAAGAPLLPVERGSAARRVRADGGLRLPVHQQQAPLLHAAQTDHAVEKGESGVAQEARQRLRQRAAIGHPTGDSRQRDLPHAGVGGTEGTISGDR